MESGGAALLRSQGFLITGILLDARPTDRAVRGARRHVLRSFYARRILRILPLYYAVIAALVLLDVEGIRETLPWHLFHASNFKFLVDDAWGGALSHFWSLAVEEQFYLFWPLLVLFAPRRHLTSIFLFTILVAPAYRWSLAVFVPELSLGEIALPGSLDTLGIGALLAALRREESALRRLIARYRAPIVWGAGIVYGVLLIGRIEGWTPPWVAAFEWTALSVIFAAIIDRAAHGSERGLVRLLDLRPLQSLGRVSYAFYLLHNFAWIPTLWTLGVLGVTGAPPAVHIALSLGWTIAGSILTWHLIETPFLRLKRHFPYRRGGAAPSRSSPGTLVTA